eukprot:TRINITY_DN4585_c0_g1_i2.p1 TRINITY_DN4585_c0_g1~~TRINITY_DN4585_c0_g1_i2.p1  ORF type:complete len:1062 (-),score=268.58 TRINITY_DN4585_c0_g1_i2:114-3299(-)
MINTTFGTMLIDYARNGDVMLEFKQLPAPQNEIDELLRFKDALGGANWRPSTDSPSIVGWTPGTNPCLTLWTGVACHDFGSISAVVVTNQNVEGRLPPTLHLPHLVILSVTLEPKLVGSIPNWVGNLTELNLLDLSSCALSGSLPSSMSSLRVSLTQLDLYNNAFSGTLPDWLGSLVLLQRLSLQQNQFEGTIPESLNLLDSLGELSLSNNKLWGTIPLTPALYSLSTMDLSYNELNGTIPDTWNDPSWALVSLVLSSNYLEGSIPALPELNISLVTLQVDGNRLSEPFPDMTTMSLLTSLDLSFNLFVEVPVESLPSSLKFLYMSNNKLWTLPPSLAGATNLLSLDLSHNSLNGTDIETIGRLPYVTDNSGGLIRYDLSYNSITGINNATILLLDSVPSLISLDLSHNKLSGQLYPQVAGTPRFVSSIDLSYNELTGTLPVVFSRIPTLRTIDFSNNPMEHSDEGLLPVGYQSNKDLMVLNVTGNFSCPSIVAQNLPTTIVLDAKYYEFKLCTCNDGHRKSPDNSKYLACIKCVEGVECEGGNVTGLMRGLYPLPSQENPLMMVACSECNPEGKFPFECAEGHLDRMCARCAPGFFKQGRRCASCSPLGPLLLAGAVVLVLAAFIFFAVAFSRSNSCISIQTHEDDDKRKSRTKERVPDSPSMDRSAGQDIELSSSSSSVDIDATVLDKMEQQSSTNRIRSMRIEDYARAMATFRSEALIGIAINYYQTLSVLSKRLSLPFSLGLLLQISDFANVTASGFGLECFDSRLGNYQAQYIITILQPIGALLAGTVVYFLGKLILMVLRRELDWWKPTCWRTVLFILNFLYFPLVTVSIAVFNCTADPFSGELYMANQPYVLCSDIPLALRIVVIIVYAVGIFVAFTGLLVRYQHSQVSVRRELRKYFGFFFLQYKPLWSYLALVVLARRVLFALMNTLVDERSVILYAANMVVLLLSIMLCLFSRPYRIYTDNYLDILSNIVLMVTYSLTYTESATNALSRLSNQQAWALGDVATYLLYIVVQVIWGLTLAVTFIVVKAPRRVRGSALANSVLTLLGANDPRH